MQHPLKVWRSDKAPPPAEDGELFIRWGCTTNVPGKRVLNTAKAIHEVNDKAAFRRVLDEHELCPATFFADELGDGREDLLEQVFPVVVRPSNHSRGRHVYLCHNWEQVIQAANKCDRTGQEKWYASEYIPKVAEYRVFVVQGRAVCVARKTPGNPDDVAWNVAQGGRFDNVRWDDWPLKAVRVSIEAFNLTSLDFGGVDVMVDAEGGAYVIEINSAPSLTSEYRQSCMAKAFDYIVEHGKERIPLIKDKGGYRKFIHPAITGKARMIE